jgi:hypothetical protein
MSPSSRSRTKIRASHASLGRLAKSCVTAKSRLSDEPRGWTGNVMVLSIDTKLDHGHKRHSRGGKHAAECLAGGWLSTHPLAASPIRPERIDNARIPRLAQIPFIITITTKSTPRATIHGQHSGTRDCATKSPRRAGSVPKRDRQYEPHGRLISLTPAMIAMGMTQ